MESNSDVFLPGSIRQITLTNFITHGYIEVLPGPNLNMILGSNGSGKSSIVAAIILGLGGTPKTIGRGQRVSEYIKHQCNEAHIVLLLQGKEDHERFTIKRSINIRDVSTWRLNGEKTIFANIKEFISTFNIQVDNLCQFLPQDRVADFAKLNKQELLLQTQIALCREDLLEKQKNLITDRQRHKSLTISVQKESQSCQELKDANQRLEGKVTNFKKMKKYMSALEDIHRKNLWLQYLEKVDERAKVKEDRDNSQKLLNEKLVAARPFRQAIDTEKRKLDTLLEGNQALLHEVNQIKNGIESKQENIDKMKDYFQDIHDEEARRLAALKDFDDEINNSKMRLNQLNGIKEELDKQVQKESSERETFQKESFTIDQGINKSIKKIDTLRLAKSNKALEIRSLESQIASQERLITNRLAYLERIDRDAYTATLWLREHKHLFRSEIFEPLMIEINVNNQNHALYVENSIGFQDKVAFLCTDKDDVETLSEHLCTRQGLKINILYEPLSSTKPRPKYNIEQLRRFGFNAYVDTLFTAPEPIVNYLCRQVGLHNIPVAFKYTEFDAEEVPVHIFYNADTKYNISVSRYSGNKAIKQSIITSDKSLSFCIDHTKVEMIKGQIEELTQQCQDINGQVTSVEQQIQEMRRCKGTLEEKVQVLRNNRQHLINIEGKIQNLQMKLRQMQNEDNPERIQEDTRTKSKRLTTKLSSLLKAVNEDLKQLTAKQLEVELDKRRIVSCRMRFEPLEIEADNICQEVRQLERTLEKIRDTFVEVTRDAKYLLGKAKDSCGGFTPDDDGFDRYRTEYDKLPDRKDALETTRDRINAHLQCVSNMADEGELKEYEERLRSIQSLQEQLESDTAILEDITTHMDQRETEWLEPLEELVGRINERFSRAFTSMGCAGEVKILKGEDERDYEKYGICVSVTYRDGAPLQELNNVTQSGGERAVATAAYMLSMQELTPVPFRCVDEINQGMDANNERRIFDLLVDVTSQVNTSQYFFISPKLVPNLKFNESIRIHFVHNSSTIVDQTRWNQSFQAFLKG